MGWGGGVLKQIVVVGQEPCCNQDALSMGGLATSSGSLEP